MIDKEKIPKYSFSVIKHRGDPNNATTLDGDKVQREDQVWIPEYGTFIMCAPYDDHFVYLDPSKKIGRWFAMCTCGGMAVITGLDGYEGQADEIRPMLLCHIHASTGVHATGGKMWI